MWCGVPELDRGPGDHDGPAPFLRGESTTIYASSKLIRVGRRAARYDSGLSAHRYKRPAHERPSPHRIAREQVACSRSRCGNLNTLYLPPVNLHHQTLPAQPPFSHNHARYDSLSRLLTSNNPEVGTITYKYDSDTNCASPNSYPGLLVSKTDARGIRTCSQFDALNRETVRNYSNGDITIATTYDQSNCLGLSVCHNIGHRTSMTDA